MKTLYFEAAGCYILHNDVESGRIRTAFTNRDGKKVYIELICGYGYMFCDSCHYITDDPKINDCMESRLPCERNFYKILIPQEFGGGFIRDEELDWLEP